MSININKQFFIITSDTLLEVKTNLYGFYLNERGIYNNKIPAGYQLAGMDGCYVYIDVADDEISIYQDFNGCFGLYLYHKEDYFAISNSFFLLADYLKTKKPLSLNRDFANHLFLRMTASEVFSETLINEIELLPRNCTVKIDKKTCSVDIHKLDFKDCTIPLDSEEGLKILDGWYERWINIIRSIYKKNNNLQIDLSGGRDSRMSFSLALGSGIDLNDVLVYCIDDKLRTHSEDFTIASLIAEHYGFKINAKNFSEEYINRNMNDIIDYAWYTIFPFKKQCDYKTRIAGKPLFVVNGFGGESIRDYYIGGEEGYIERGSVNAKKSCFKATGKELYESNFGLRTRALEGIKNNYFSNKADNNPFDTYLMPLIFRHTECRHHFGKEILYYYLSNVYCLSPLLSHDLYRLQLHNNECVDNNMLMALIFVRYYPELLDFPIQGNRVIDSETIEAARKICNEYPYTEYNNTEEFEISLSDEKMDFPAYSCDRIDKNEIRQYMFDLFSTSCIHDRFCSNFNEELYLFANDHAVNNDFHALRHCNSVLAITKTLQIIDTNNELMHSFIKEYFDYVLDKSPKYKLNEIEQTKIEEAKPKIIIKYKTVTKTKIKYVLDQELLEEKLDTVYNSKSYKIGNAIIQPFHWIKTIMKK